MKNVNEAKAVENPPDVIRKTLAYNDEAMLCHFHLKKNEIEEKYKIIFSDYFSSELSDLTIFTEDQLVELTENEIIVNENGRIVIRNIAMIFDSYLRNKEQKKYRFSKTL